MTKYKDSNIEYEPYAPWPSTPELGLFLITCSCSKWHAVGTVEEINEASRNHSDAPWRNHIVSVKGRVTNPTYP